MVRCPLCFNKNSVVQSQYSDNDNWYECNKCNIEFNSVTQVVIDLDKKEED